MMSKRRPYQSTELLLLLLLLFSALLFFMLLLEMMILSIASGLAQRRSWCGEDMAMIQDKVRRRRVTLRCKRRGSDWQLHV